MNAHTITLTANNTAADASVPVAPYKVDVSKGSVRGDVSSQWASRPADQKFDTLGALYDYTKAVHDSSFESRCSTAEFVVVEPDLDSGMDGLSAAEQVAEAKRRCNRLTIGVKRRDGGDVTRDVEIAPTHHAFNQLCSLADAPAAFMRKLPSPLVAQNINYQMRYARKAEGVLAYGTEDQLLAVTGQGYGRIPDHEIVAALMTIAGQGKGDDGYHWKAPGRLNWANGTYDPEDIGPVDDRTFYASDRDLFVFLVDDRRPIVVGKTRDGGDDLLFRGFFFQNSCVGTRSMKLATFYLRGVCMNRNLWGVEGFKEITMRHTTLAPSRWLNEVRPALESFANSSDRNVVEGVQRAKAKILADNDAEAIAFLKSRQMSFSETRASAILAQGLEEEGKPVRSIWDFAQAITANARNHANTDDRLEDEMKAKKILDMVK